MDMGGLGLGHRRDRNQNWETYQKSRHPLSQSLSFLFPKHPIYTFAYLSVSLPTSVDQLSFLLCAKGRLTWSHSASLWEVIAVSKYQFQILRRKIAMDPAWVSHLPRSIHPGPWGRGNKLQMWLPDPPLRLREEVLRGGRSQVRQ